MERERSGARTKLVAQISLKGDASLYSNFVSVLTPISKIIINLNFNSIFQNWIARCLASVRGV